jgi:16S rRNA (cytosine967-C5)-methyltransferase
LTARRVALEALIAVERGARANVAVPQLLDRSSLDGRDRHLVTELVYGACRMQRACDWLADQYRRGRVDDEVKAALRLGVYQIGWTRIPPHAAVSATVDAVRGRGKTLVNAVLRRVATDFSMGLVAWPDTATRLSYPDWIVERLSRDLGPDQAVAALEQMNQAAAATPRPDGYIQDRASQMVADYLVPYAGDRTADICAAPGGKATALASGGAGIVAASDISFDRTRVVAGNAQVLGLSNVAALTADGRRAPYRRAALDLVLVDAPCSGLGVLRRRPDARWRVQAGDIDRLASLQKRLLAEAATLVRPGGVLAYSVCTLTATETGGIDKWLMKSMPQLEALPPPGDPWQPAGRGALLLPQTAGTDGMFLLTLRRGGQLRPDPGVGLEGVG